MDFVSGCIYLAIFKNFRAVRSARLRGRGLTRRDLRLALHEIGPVREEALLFPAFAAICRARNRSGHISWSSAVFSAVVLESIIET